ncbi:NEL-type E3 ubiquitin ligase domain-containing protein [uncultured Pseudomonas sp.]|uniref:NEL-type E3 ubiquitin ligase domain-containing protein n=1 Tax=uncultured Pseudomonas sp. TaxID=114707 RepID=UPI0025D3BEB1|nr:NEL-type E3 ubiquitin ligase domain-containing protein [uncultured Pseudomonas sp.]
MASAVASPDHIDRFISEHMPDWLHAASVEQIAALRTRFDDHRVIEHRLQALFKSLAAPEPFARERLSAVLEHTFKVKVDLRHAIWRERWDSYSMMGAEALRDHYTYDTAMSHLMQNFPSGSSFDAKSGLIELRRGASAAAAAVVVDSAQLAQACRTADVGAQYQKYLQTFFNASVSQLLAQDQRKRLALAVELAGLQQGITEADVVNLEHTLGEQAAPNPRQPAVAIKHLSVLGHALLGALILELSDAGSQHMARPSAGLLLYLPHHPLQRFANLEDLNAHLVTLLRDPRQAQALFALIALEAKSQWQLLLRKRLSDPVPDLEVTGQAAGAELFDELARLQVTRIKEDARYLLVPVADVDSQVRLHRLQTLQEVGLNLLQLAAVFVPQLGQLMLAATVVQVLEELYESVHDWSRGHQHEALEHMLGVAEVVAVNALGAAGGVAVARGFKRSAFVDELVPVEPASDTASLWSQDLAPFRVARKPPHASRGADGLYHHGDQRWWLYEGHFHPVRRDPLTRQWRLERTDGQPGFAPALQWNGEYGWRLAWQRPQEWHGGFGLLERLWPVSSELDAARIDLILKVADIEHAELRRLVSEQRALPVPLRDTLQRFAADTRIDKFFLATGQKPQLHDSQLFEYCLEQLPVEQRAAPLCTQAILDQAPALRQKLMTHLSESASKDGAVTIIQRDFPGLPDAYAAALLEQASTQQQQRLRVKGSLDLALAERARLALQQARVCRTLQGLYLSNAYHPDLPALVFALLRQAPAWPPEINFQVREGSAQGRLVAELYPQQGGVMPKVLVWRDGQMCVHENGVPVYPMPLRPRGLVETLWHFLPEGERTRLECSGEQGVAALRASLQQRLPSDRAKLRELMGITASKPTFRAPKRLPDRRFGYLLSGRGAGNHLAERTLQDRVRSLYPGFSERQLELFLRVLDEQPGSPFTILLDLEREFSRLEQTLDRWVERTESVARRPQRRRVADELKRCWRFQGQAGRPQANGDPGMFMDLSGIAAGALPDLSGQDGFSHVSEVSLANMQLRDIPSGFLQAFRSLLTLNLDNNSLAALPQALSYTRHLRELTLSRNELQMNDASFALLTGLPRLQVLDMSDNHFGNFTLALDRLPRLRQLGLRDVGLTEVPRSLEHAVSLESVDLRDNQISDLPQALRTQRLDWRRRLFLAGNPLPEVYRELWFEPSRTSDSELSSEGDAFQISRWMDRLDTSQRALRTAQWNRLLAEAGSGDFFTLVSELTETSDFSLARADLEARLWSMFDRLEQNTTLRERTFALASEPRTCVDSVISNFGLLEVNMLSASVEDAAGADTEAQLLSLARRFFRLDQVEAYALQDMHQREARGTDVDQVEVSLAYRVGLARELDLPGQARTLQFETIADVSQQDLSAAQAAVREAEASDRLALDISQRSFWFDHLQRRHRSAFDLIREPFAEQMETLYADRQSMTDAQYDAQAKAIAKACDSAVQAKALALTQQALAKEAGEGVD